MPMAVSRRRKKERTSPRTRAAATGTTVTHQSTTRRATGRPPTWCRRRYDETLAHQHIRHEEDPSHEERAGDHHHVEQRRASDVAGGKRIGGAAAGSSSGSSLRQPSMIPKHITFPACRRCAWGSRCGRCARPAAGDSLPVTVVFFPVTYAALVPFAVGKRLSAIARMAIMFLEVVCTAAICGYCLAGYKHART
ncbi:hypothetical protein ABZP36_008752 [Zizania latifolia]